MTHRDVRKAAVDMSMAPEDSSVIGLTAPRGPIPTGVQKTLMNAACSGGHSGAAHAVEWNGACKTSQASKDERRQ